MVVRLLDSRVYICIRAGPWNVNPLSSPVVYLAQGNLWWSFGVKHPLAIHAQPPFSVAVRVKLLSCMGFSLRSELISTKTPLRSGEPRHGHQQGPSVETHVHRSHRFRTGRNSHENLLDSRCGFWVKSEFWTFHRRRRQYSTEKPRDSGRFGERPSSPGASKLNFRALDAKQHPKEDHRASSNGIRTICRFNRTP